MKNHLDFLVHTGSGAGFSVVNGSVALARGAAGRGSRFAVLDGKGRGVPAQVRVLGRWEDGSARWVLLDFSMKAGGGLKAGEAAYRVVWGGKVAQTPPEVPVKAIRGVSVGLRTGTHELRVTEGCVLGLGGWKLDWMVADGRGKAFNAKVERAELEPGVGPVRGTLALAGAFVDAAGKRLMGWRLRASVFAGSGLVKLEPMMMVDTPEGVIHKIRSMKLRLSPVTGEVEGKLGRVFQVDDEQVKEGKKVKPGRAPGHLKVKAGEQTLSLALRDFWQRWPKAFDVKKEGVDVELFPGFEAGQFDHMEPWYKYGYLFDGTCYQLKTGQARRWELWVDLAGGDSADLAAHVNEPAVLLSDPAQAMATGVWGDGLPAGAKGAKEYDAWVKRLFGDFCKSQHKQRDYGEMNFGDWFGERHVNWGNNEYDTGYELFFQAARMNDPAMHRAADAAARHASEVDVVHFTNEDLNASYGPYPKGFPPRPGMMHEHCVGHVGGFYTTETVRRLLVSFSVGKSKRPYLCLDPFNLGHVWTRGIARHYFLTGDPWSKRTVELMGDSLARLTEEGEYEYFSRSDHSGRVAGWTLEALSGAYEINFDKRYLRAMKHIVDLNLSEQDPNCGGWLYSLPWGHCFCKTQKHVGEAGFLTAIRVNGLYRYYRLTGDKRIPEVIRRAMTHLNNDTWKDEFSDWRYTSCPQSIMVGRQGVIMQAMAASVALTGDPEHKRVLARAWEATCAHEGMARGTNGKAFTTTLTGTAQTVAALGEGRRKV